MCWEVGVKRTRALMCQHLFLLEIRGRLGRKEAAKKGEDVQVCEG